MKYEIRFIHIHESWIYRDKTNKRKTHWIVERQKYMISMKLYSQIEQILLYIHKIFMKKKVQAKRFPLATQNEERKNCDLKEMLEI